MKRLPAAGIVVALLLGGSSHGEEIPTPGFSTGNDLVEACAAPVSDPSYLTCLVYIGGVSDTLDFLQTAGLLSKVYCMPKSITQGQLAAVFSKYLHDNPAKRQLVAANLLIDALLDAFPCKKRSEQK